MKKSYAELVAPSTERLAGRVSPEDREPAVISRLLFPLDPANYSAEELEGKVRLFPLAALTLLELDREETLFEGPDEGEMLEDLLDLLGARDPPSLMLAALGETARERVESLDASAVHPVEGDSLDSLLRLVQLLLLHAQHFCDFEAGEIRDFQLLMGRYNFGWVLVSREVTELEAMVLELLADLGVRVLSAEELPIPRINYQLDSLDDLTGEISDHLSARSPYLDHGLLQVTSGPSWIDTNSDSFLVVRDRGGVDGVDSRGVQAGGLGVVVDLPESDIRPEVTLFLEQTLTELLTRKFGLPGEENGAEAPLDRIDPGEVGEEIYDFLKRNFHVPKVGVSVVFDDLRLKQVQSSIHSYLHERDQFFRRRTELDSPFYLSLRHSTMTPAYAGICTSELPPMHGETYPEVMTRAVLTDDPTYLALKKGRLLDRNRWEFAGVNKLFTLLTDGEVTRVQLHAVGEYPLPGCAAMQNVAVRLPDDAGIALLHRDYRGTVPGVGKMRELVAQMVGEQIPGRVGFADAYLGSDNFLRGSGGWDSVVWATEEVQRKAEQYGVESDLLSEKDTVSITRLQ